LSCYFEFVVIHAMSRLVGLICLILIILYSFLHAIIEHSHLDSHIAQDYLAALLNE
jgi:hypothetical protein